MNIPFEKLRDVCKHNDDFEDIECNPICVLMTPTLTKPGPHAYTGKEVLCNEENCPLIKQESEKDSTEIKHGVMERVRKREAYLKDFKRCLAVSICPKCGSKLRRVSDSFGTDYQCLDTTCTFTCFV